MKTNFERSEKKGSADRKEASSYLKELEKLANTFRQEIIEMLLQAKSGHCAGPLGAVEEYIALYFGGILKYDSQNPDWLERDRVIVSNGHYAPLLYAVLAHAGYFGRSEKKGNPYFEQSEKKGNPYFEQSEKKGNPYFPLEELKTLRKLGSRLQGHPHRLSLPGIETSSGPAGEGLSQAIGMAIGLKMDGLKSQVYCLMGDGEHDCGNTWEAAMLAGKLQLDNLTVIIDRNNIQIDGFTEKVMPLEPLKEKYEAFNWKVLEVDGHNIEELVRALNKAKSIFVKPVAIIANTIPGKGVDFIEWEYQWHGKVPNSKEAEEALRQLRTMKGKIQSELD